MMEWWSNLTTLNQVFFGAAAFFSVIFLWQFVSSLIGLAGGAEVDVDAHGDLHADVGTDADFHGDVHADADAEMHMDADHPGVDHVEAHSVHEASESVAAFRILSVRAILAFCTLFTWAGALYLSEGRSIERSLVLALAWGLAGWLVVTLLVNVLRKLQETGTRQLQTAVGGRGQVYLDIPVGGQGEVRAMVSGVVSLVKARSADGGAIASGTPVRIVRLLDPTTVEVEAVSSLVERKEQKP